MKEGTHPELKRAGGSVAFFSLTADGAEQPNLQTVHCIIISVLMTGLIREHTDSPTWAFLNHPPRPHSSSTSKALRGFQAGRNRQARTARKVKRVTR